jgi:hypothetical protein
MIRRIVSDITAHATVAKEISLGIYEAFATMTTTRRRSMIESAFARQDAHIQSGLPGF